MISFTFITPIHKIPPTFVKCIEGLENQTIDFEWIIIVNGPFLKEKDVANYLENSVILTKTKIIYRPDLNGPSSSRNIGIENSSSRYIIFLDSDDYLEASYLKYIQQMIDQIDEKTFALAANGKRFRDGKSSNGKNNLVFSSRELSRSEISLNYIGSITGFCITQDLQIRFTNDIIFFEDYDFYMKILNAGIKIYGCYDAIYNYCLDQNSLTNLTRKKNFVDIIKARKAISLSSIKNLPNFGARILASCQISRLFYLHKGAYVRFLCYSFIIFILYPPYFYHFFKRLFINLKAS